MESTCEVMRKKLREGVAEREVAEGSCGEGSCERKLRTGSCRQGGWQNLFCLAELHLTGTPSKILI